VPGGGPAPARSRSTASRVGGAINTAGDCRVSRRVGCVKAFMQLAGTREAGHQGGRVGAPGLAEPRRPGSDRPMDQAVPAQALGVDDVGCSARHGSGGPAPGDLPGLRMPRSMGRWITRDGYIDYLERFGAHQRLDIRFGEHVRHLDRSPGGWCVATAAGDYATDHVIVATGTTGSRGCRTGPEASGSPSRSCTSPRFGGPRIWLGWVCCWSGRATPAWRSRGLASTVCGALTC
jgi:hypothetical protein